MMTQMETENQEASTVVQIILPIQYANLPPDRQDKSIILPASLHMNHYLPVGICYQLADLYQLAGYILPTTVFSTLSN